jgi:SagB-type dehydrogenase family enzyme
MSILSEKEYHELTDYRPDSPGGGGMFRSVRPEPFKPYQNLDRVRLPETEDLPEKPYADVLRETAQVGRELGLDGLARLLACSHSITAAASGGGRKFYLRSAPSAGALYPSELYLVASGVDGLENGVYHHHVLRRELSRLREGNFAKYCSDSFGDGDEPAGLTCIVTAIFHRCAWKYGKRAYRYCCMDAGHLAEAIVLAARAMGVEASVHLLESADAADRLVCVDGEGEASLLAVSVHTASSGGGFEEPGPLPPELLEGGSPEGPVHAEIKAAYRASLGEGADVEGVRIEASDIGLEVLGSTGLPAHPDGANQEFAETVYDRRSKRRYGRGLNSSQAGSMAAALRGAPDAASRVGVISTNAGDLADGFHLLDLEKGSIGLVREGDMRRKFAEACLGQSFIAGGSLIFVMLTDLVALESKFGPGGYRRALIEAGRQGHRVYLGATALGLSACGVGAFFDYTVRDLLGLAETSRMLYLTVSG